MLPTVHYNMGGIPTNYHGEVLTKPNGNPDTLVPGLMAVGEAACVSVHGANRLGSNSLIDLVVFGRAAGLRAAETIEPGEKHARPAARRRRRGARPARPFPPRQWRHADRRTAPQMQKTMQEDCAVFRTGEVLDEGQSRIDDVWSGLADIRSPTAR